MLRRSKPGRLQVCGADFALIEPASGQRAVVYLSGNRPDSQRDFADTEFSIDYWHATLSAVSQEQSDNQALQHYKVSSGRHVGRMALPLPGRRQVTVMCKDSLLRSPRQRIAAALRGSKEWREFWMGHRLLALGVPTPLPLACVWLHGRWCPVRSTIISVFVENAVPLDRAVRMLQTRPDRHPDRAANLGNLADQLVNMITLLGARRLWHRDLKVGNILVSNVEDKPRAWLIDLDGMDTERRPCGPGFERSLARLILSLADATTLTRTAWLRILRRFLAAQHPPHNDWKSTWTTLQRQVQTLATKKNKPHQ